MSRLSKDEDRVVRVCNWCQRNTQRGDCIKSRVSSEGWIAERKLLFYDIKQHLHEMLKFFDEYLLIIPPYQLWLALAAH